MSASNCVNHVTLTRPYLPTRPSFRSQTCTQTITVNDNLPPAISCPAAVTVACASEVPAPDPAGVTARDDCGGTPVVTFVGDSMSASNCVNQFTLTRTYRANDDCGNSQ